MHISKKTVRILDLYCHLPRKGAGMTKIPNIRLTIGFNGPNLELEERDREALRLLSDLREVDDIEEVSLVPDLNPPERNKTEGGFLIGLLTAEVNFKNIKSVFHFLENRLSGKPIDLEVEANGKRLKVSARNPEELRIAIEEAQKFVSGSTSAND